jgi:hypothetical protein
MFHSSALDQIVELCPTIIECELFGYIHVPPLAQDKPAVKRLCGTLESAYQALGIHHVRIGIEHDFAFCKTLSLPEDI